MVEKYRSSLAEIRKSKGISQKRLAELVGAHWITISKLERGKMRLTWEWASQLSRALEINISDIFSKGITDSSLKIKLNGQINSGGSIGELMSLSDENVMLTMEKAIITESSYYYVDTDDFAPIIRKEDILRLTPIANEPPKDLVGRLCLGREQERRTVGVLLFGQAPGSFELRSLAGTLLAPAPVEVEAFVTMILCATRIVDHMPLRDFFQNS